jgi:ssDNA-binding Zn-finger/Zn-ribbon topoisomerase 1
MREKHKLSNWGLFVDFDGEQLKETMCKDDSAVMVSFIRDDYETIFDYVDNALTCYKTLYDRQERFLIFENREIVIGYDKELFGGFYVSIQTGKEEDIEIEGETETVHNCDMISLTRKELAKLGDFFYMAHALPDKYYLSAETKKNFGDK